MYTVHMGSLYTYRIHELTKFIKKSEKMYTYSFHTSPSVYKISASNSYNEGVIKKIKFLTDV
jgi:hypothetical protein